MKKRTLLALTVLCLVFNYAIAQKPVLKEDFEIWPAAGWNIYSFTPNNGAWVGGTPGYNSNGYARHGFVSGPTTAPHNNWLVSPAVSITTNNYKLSFNGFGASGNVLGCKVMVSIAGGVPTATGSPFTLLYTESAHNTGWPSTPYVVDLSAYVGKTIYIGFQMNNGTSPSTNIPYSLDNVSIAPIAYTNASITSVLAPIGYSASASSQSVKVRVKNTGTQALSGYSIAWKVDGGLKTPPTSLPSIAAGATADITLGTNSFIDGNHTIEATVNATSDIDLSDNTLIGYYSVGANNNKDAAVTGVYPNGSAQAAGAQPVIVTIQNNGTSTMSNFKIDWKINGGTATTYSESAITIPVGEAKNITVGNYTFSSATAEYSIEAKLVELYDPNQSNNVKKVLYSASCFNESFNDPLKFPPHNWSSQLSGPVALMTQESVNTIFGDPTNLNVNCGAALNSQVILWGPILNIAAGDVVTVKTLADNMFKGNGSIVYRSSSTGPINTVGTITNPSGSPTDPNRWITSTFNLTAGLNQIGYKTVSPAPADGAAFAVNWDELTSTAPYAYPVQPGNLAATPSGALSWMTNTVATGYTIQYRAVGATTWTTQNPTTNSYAMTGLVNGTKYEVQVRANNASGSSEFSSSIIFAASTGGGGLTLNLTALIEGFFSTATATSITVELHSSTSPNTIVTSKTGTLSATGTCQLIFSAGTTGVPYYIVVKHLNSLETWSTPVTFTTTTQSYDFTTGASKFYNGQMKQVGTKSCIYSGDVNQDGIIEGSDYTEIFNDAAIWKEGANLPTDVNGDAIVEGSDATIGFNNSGFIELQRP